MNTRVHSHRPLRWPATTVTAAVTAAVTAVLLTLTAGCGAESGTGGGGTGASGALPEGWGTLRTATVTVAYPPAFTPLSAAERGKYNAAAAKLTEDGEKSEDGEKGKDVGMISVQLGFTNADTPEEAAIGAEAGIALGSTLKRQTEIEVNGPDGAKAEARRVDFEFTEKGSRVKGVIVAGIDTAKKAYAVRIDAVKGKLGDDDLRRILDSITLK
ncbi:hypothetical protein [Streptomyces paludis]|uniref:Uncharacterized protein n=1 Tax=Streptomyces paludis TaxID=2282738 RepID=A0A345HTI5_9ACTN|nr:hypothetical protein [Streptomyces paludis]AXG80009.1 hypothetical protein DVK44_22785 [Streptomyces paludis]